MDIQQRSRFALVRTTSIALLWAAAMSAPLAAAVPPVDEVQLGDAPRREVPQDTSDWRERPTLKAAPTRDGVAQLYKSVYVPGAAVMLSWTGDVAGCNAGTTNLAHRQAVIDRVNYARTLAGLPPVTLLDGSPTTQAQAAALMMSANNALSHTPPTSWLCYSTNGADGAGHSNIALGAYGVGAVDLYLDDPGAGNAATGHRRWILYPPQVSIATGDVFRTGSGATPAANDLYVLGTFGTRPATPNGIAWPPAGFVPYQNLPASSKRWSFSYPSADFTGASVTMTGPAGPIPVTLEALANGFGDNTIVFLPTGVSYGNPGADTTYTINVSGMKGAGVPPSIQYAVTVIDPLAAGPASAVSYGGVWWTAPGGSESGWGLTVFHEGDVIFLGWFTYDATGKTWWLSMTANKTAANTYTGTLIQSSGPAFNAVPFDPAKVTRTTVGTGTLTFSDAGNGSFAYTVNTATGPVTQMKQITRVVFDVMPTCTYAAQPDFVHATNYQDVWWVIGGAEGGWGLALTHQGDVVFVGWFTYDLDGTPLWLSASALKTAAGVYTGSLIRTTGPAFNAVPFDPNRVIRTPVGTMTLTFANGNSATFSYAVNTTNGPVTQTKTLTRALFVPPAGTLCQ